MGNFNRIMIGVCLITLLVLPAMAAGANGNITSMWGIIGNPIDAFNTFDKSTKTTLQWGLAVLVIATVVAVFFGTSKNTIVTSVGSKTKDAKMTTSGIQDNIMILVTALVGIIVLGVAIGLFAGLGK